MKKQFSLAWQSSKQPRKQRKFSINAPLHIKHRFLSAHLSNDLKKKYGKRSLPLRKGDEVLVMRGSFAKKKAKVVSVDVKNSQVSLENLNRSKKDGTKVGVNFHPSSLMITSIGSSDSKRIKGSVPEKKAEKPTEKTSEKATEKVKKPVKNKEE